MSFAAPSASVRRAPASIQEQAKLVARAGLWATCAPLRQLVLQPPGELADDFRLLMPLSANNTATLLAAGAFDVVLACDPHRQADELPKVAASAYLDWNPPLTPDTLYHPGGRLMRISLDERRVAWSDWLVQEQGRIVGLSLFGRPQHVRAIAAALERREPLMASPAAAGPSLVISPDPEAAGRYFVQEQSLAIDLEHRLWVHPDALLHTGDPTGRRRYYLIGRQPLYKFVHCLRRYEPVPFLPTWAPQLYAFASERGWVREVGAGTLKVEFPEVGPNSPFARFLVRALREGQLPIPDGYDFLARTVPGKAYALLEESVDSERQQQTRIELERFGATTWLLYFDGQLVRLEPGTEADPDAPAVPELPPLPEGGTPCWLPRYRRRPRKICSLGEYIQTLLPQVPPPQPHWQGEDYCVKAARRPFRAQRDAVNAIVHRFKTGGRAAALIAQTGAGKSLMGVLTAASLARASRRTPFHVLVLAPPHLVQEDEQTGGSQWREEIEATLGRQFRFRVVPVQGTATFEQYRQELAAGKVKEELVFFLVTPHVLRGSRQHLAASLERRRLAKAAVLRLSGGPPARLPLEPGKPERFPAGPTPWAKRCLLGTCLRLWRRDKHTELVSLASHAPRLLLDLLDSSGGSAVAAFLRRTLSKFAGEESFAALWQARLALLRREAQAEEERFCPDCLRPLGADEETLAEKPTHCGGCGGALFRWSEVQRRCQWPLARWLRRAHFPIDLAIADEAHMYKARDTSQAAAFRALVSHARRTLAMTASPSDGYASSLHFLLYTLSASFRRDYRFGEVSRFARHFGLWQRTIVTNLVDNKRTTSTRERPGIHPFVLKRYLLEIGVPLLLSDLEDLQMPPLAQYQHLVAMEPEQAQRVHDFSRQITGALQKVRSQGWRIAAAALQKQLVCPDLCFNGEAFTVHDAQNQPLAQFEALDGIAGQAGECLRLLPKEEAVFRLLARQKALGRKVLVYVCHTGRYDYIGRFLAASDHYNARPGSTPLRIAGFYVQPPSGIALYEAGEPPPDNRRFVLESSPHDRRRKLLGILPHADAVVINSRCVETGLNLREFPTLVYLEVPFGATNFRQSGARSWRPGQTKPVEVHAFVYRDSFQLAALKLVGAKLAYDNRVRGELLMGSLEEDGIDGDLIHELSKFIRGELSLDQIRETAFSDYEEGETVQTLFKYEPARYGRRKKAIEGVYQGLLF